MNWTTTRTGLKIDGLCVKNMRNSWVIVSRSLFLDLNSYLYFNSVIYALHDATSSLTVSLQEMYWQKIGGNVSQIFLCTFSLLLYASINMKQGGNYHVRWDIQLISCKWSRKQQKYYIILLLTETILSIFGVSGLNWNYSKLSFSFFLVSTS